ncbi:MAG: hypothetical protein U0X73_00630 [Thermoanaerobaculia bacterium]
MTGRGLLAAALALAAAPVVAAPAAPAAPAVALAVEGLAWSGHAIRLRIDQGRPIASSSLRFYVFVDDNQLETVDTRGGTSRFTLATVWPAPGRHRLKVRSGTLEASTTVRVVGSGEIAAAIAALLALAGVAGGLVYLRARRTLPAA